jgi:predicted lipid-binding transport protein (Tim44 family)
MEIFGDLTTLVALAIAVFIFLRLRSVLGKRTGHQQQPFDHKKASDERSSSQNAGNDNIVTLPKRGPHAPAEDRTVETAEAEIDALAKPGSKLNRQLKEMIAADSSFEPESFVEGAKMAYEMIVTAFADGERKTLRNLLSRDVYEGFSAAIADREAKGEEVRSSFVSIDNAEIRAAELIKHDAQVTVRFVSQIISATYGSDGQLVEGDPDQIAEVIDVWTFSRDTRSKDPNWKLVATGSES